MNNHAAPRTCLARTPARATRLTALLLTGLLIGCVADDPNLPPGASGQQSAAQDAAAPETQASESQESEPRSAENSTSEPQASETPAAEPQASETQSAEAPAADPASETQSAEAPAADPASEAPAPASDRPTTESVKPETPETQMASLPPVQLVGMSRDDVIKHLGKPVFQRRDRTALLLRYRNGRCILDLFLYPSETSGLDKAVDYVEARSDDGKRIESPPCIDAIRRANAAG